MLILLLSLLAVMILITWDLKVTWKQSGGRLNIEFCGLFLLQVALLTLCGVLLYAMVTLP